MTPDRWSSADAYDTYMGRWSRRLALTALTWLDPPSGLRWLDVGCGTGALSEAVLARADPSSLVGVDPTEAYVASAAARLTDRRVTIRRGAAGSLPVPDASVDRVVCGLVLNFVPDPIGALSEMRRVLDTGGLAAAYVWDYAEGMQLLRTFWDAVLVEDPAAEAMDEGIRSPITRSGALAAAFVEAGFRQIESEPVEIPMTFRDFDDYWTPFLGGQGPAGSYCVGLAEEARSRLRERLRESLPTSPDGSIALTARAHAVVGTSTT